MKLAEIRKIIQWLVVGLLVINTTALFFYASKSLLILAITLITCLLVVEALDIYQNKQRSMLGILVFIVMIGILIVQVGQPHLFMY